MRSNRLHRGDLITSSHANINIPPMVTFQSIYDNKDSRTNLYLAEAIPQSGANNLGVNIWSTKHPQDKDTPSSPAVHYVGKNVDLKNKDIDSLFVEVINNILLQTMEPINLHCVNYIGAYCNPDDICVSFTMLAGKTTFENSTPQHAFHSLPLFLSRFSNVGRKYGLTHNDLHPANIMLCEDNILRMIDYGRVHMFEKHTSGRLFKGLKGFNGIAEIVNIHFGNRLRTTLSKKSPEKKIHYRDVLALNKNTDYYLNTPWKTSDGKHYLNYMFDVANICLNVFDKLDEVIPTTTERLFKFFRKTSPFQSSVAVMFQDEDEHDEDGVSFRKTYESMVQSAPIEYSHVFKCLRHGLEFFYDYLIYSAAQVYTNTYTGAYKLMAVGIESMTWKFVDNESKQSFINHISMKNLNFGIGQRIHVQGGFYTRTKQIDDVLSKKLTNVGFKLSKTVKTIKEKGHNPVQLKQNPFTPSKWDRMIEESTKTWKTISDDITMNRLDKKVLEKSNDIIRRTFSEPSNQLKAYLRSTDRTEFVKHMKEEQQKLRNKKMN
jgi:serine/threonine protein kinase